MEQQSIPTLMIQMFVPTRSRKTRHERDRPPTKMQYPAKVGMRTNTYIVNRWMDRHIHKLTIYFKETNDHLSLE